MIKQFRLFFISVAVLVVGVIYLSYATSAQLNAYKNKKEQIATELGFEERLLTPDEYLADFLPFFSSDEDKVEQWQKWEQEASAKYNGALMYALLIGILVLAFVAFNVGFYKNKAHKYQVYGLVMVFASLSFLYLGLQSPFIEIMAYKKDLAFEVPALGNYEFEGRIYFFYQNKSIMQLIGILYTGGNFLVAIIVLLFSIVFPLFKLTVSVMVLLQPEKKQSIKQYKLIRNLGKWSMADVFTAGIFLAFFAYSNMEVGVDTGSETLLGTYFYLLFVVLSINSGQYLKKAMKKAQPVAEWDLI